MKSDKDVTKSLNFLRYGVDCSRGAGLKQTQQTVWGPKSTNPQPNVAAFITS